MSMADYTHQPVGTKKAHKKKHESNWAAWVNTHTCVFNTEEVYLILELEKEGIPDMADFITQMADIGIKTTCKYDRRTNQYHMQVFRDNPEMVDAGYAISVKASSFQRCVIAMTFALGDTQVFNLEQLTEVREGFAPDL